MREPDAVSAKRFNNGLRELLQTAQWQGEWTVARKIAYNDRRIDRLSKQNLRRLATR